MVAGAGLIPEDPSAECTAAPSGDASTGQTSKELRAQPNGIASEILEFFCGVPQGAI